MKKSFLTLAAIALVLSFTSCKETSTETSAETTEEVIETENMEAEISEEVEVEEVDSLSTGEAEIEEEITETPEI